MTKGKSERNLLSWNTLGVRYDLNIIRHALIVVTLWLLSGGATADDNTPPPSDPYGLNGKFNPSMAIIIVVLISAFFFMGFFSIYIRQCAGESDTVRLPNGQGGGGRSRRGTRGLDPAVIETFPTFVYSVVKGLKLGKGTLECAVCLSEFQDDETLRLLPKCDHVFHPDCIDAWLSSHTTCPVCRANLVPDPAAVVAEPADIEAGPEDENHATSDAVEIPIEEETTQDPPILVKVSSCRVPPELFQNRPPRTRSSRWSRFTGRFPRSHSTGHSIVQGDNYERYTLRLPENVRKQIVRAKLNRTISCVAFPNEGGSVSGNDRAGGYKGGEGSSRGRSLRYGRLEPVVKSDRWVFTRTPNFFSRTFSGHSPKGGEVEAPTSSKPAAQSFLPYLRNSFDCLGGKPEAAEQSSPPLIQSPAPGPPPALR